jgi:hypothetical protein
MAEDVIDKNVKMLMPEPDQSRHDLFLRGCHATGSRTAEWIARQIAEAFPWHSAPH